MTKIVSLLTLLVTVLVATLPAAPAQAQAQRTFVSAAGSDSNNCATVTTPCRHFANAYAVTAPNGEIDVLDPANYGSLTITGPVSIEGHGWASSAAVSGQAAITINASGATDKINIIGVVLDGIAIAGTTGIKLNGGGNLHIQDSVIRNFGNGGGIIFQPNVPSQLSVSNTLISDNAADAINIFPTGSGATTGVLDHVVMENNAGNGLSLTSSATLAVNVTVSDSVLANNLNGVGVATNAGTIEVMVRNCTIANNTNVGLSANAAIANAVTIWVTRSTITGNGTGWSALNSGTVTSYADNNIDGNTNANTAPPQIGYK
jgi:hypothetical protein